MSSLADFIDSLSLISGAALVACISVLVVLPTLAARVRVRCVTAIVGPGIASYVVYWTPVWLHGGHNSAEYVAWAGLVVVPWFVAGICAAGAVVGASLLVTFARHASPPN